MSLVSLWEGVKDVGSTVIDYASSSDVFNDIVTGAAIGAGTAWMMDENPWAGAAIGGAGGGLASGTRYDISDFLFGGEEMAGQSGGAYTMNPETDISTFTPNQPVPTQGKGIIGRMGDYMQTDSGGKVAAAGAVGVGNYLTKQAEAEELEKARNNQALLEKKLSRVNISGGRKGIVNSIAPWASAK